MQTIMEQSGIEPYADGKILTAVDGAVGMVSFNQPEKLNAMSVLMWDGIARVLEKFEKDERIRVVIFSGTGNKAFMSGGDISEFGKFRSSAEAEDHFRKVTSPGRDRLTNFQKPKIAAIRGYCMGGGLTVAMAMDLRIAGASSQFSIPAARLGLAYGAADIGRLISLVGPAHARSILYTAEKFDASTAARMGLINEAVPDDAVDHRCLDLARKISNNAPFSVDAAKFTIDELVNTPLSIDTQKVRELTARCMNSEDYKEGRSAFKEKRQPLFLGR